MNLKKELLRSLWVGLWLSVWPSWPGGIYLPITTGRLHLNLSYSTLPEFLQELGQLGPKTLKPKTP